jgi:Zn-dependent M28 family amino/carboxypeptidase
MSFEREIPAGLRARPGAIRSRLAVILAAVSLAGAIAAPLSAQVDVDELAQHLDMRAFEADLRFISSDLTGGRAPASVGEAITVEYLEARLRMAGAEGAFDGSFRQPVPLVRQRADDAMELRIHGTDTDLRYRFGDEFVVDSGLFTPRVDVDAGIVFVGYGTVAPEYRWDDYKGLDVSGKVLMMLVNDPPATDAEPDLFEAEAMTYYGRWTYKYEIAEQMGAAGVLLVHVTDMAGYGWNVVESSWSGDQFSFERDDDSQPLRMRGWVQRPVAEEIVSMAGEDLDDLIVRARSRDFRPVPLDLQAQTTIRNETERMTGYNVVGMIPGCDRHSGDAFIMYSAHLDHLGTGEGEGDVIYNGAYDNASGCSAVLALADVIGSVPQMDRPCRSFLFAFVTAEESGLLGSAWLARNPPVQDTKIVAAINLDGINLWGETDDLVMLGGDRTGIWDVVKEVGAPMGMTLKPDPNPAVGSFFRSDHFSFAKVGIPATSLEAGDDYRGRPEGWGKERSDRWTAETYHQPGDEFSEDYVYDGALQVIGAALRAGMAIAASEEWIQWREGDPFGRIRAEKMGGGR